MKDTTSLTANVRRKHFDFAMLIFWDRTMRWLCKAVTQQFAASSKRVQCDEPSRNKPSDSPAKRSESQPAATSRATREGRQRGDTQI